VTARSRETARRHRPAPALSGAGLELLLAAALLSATGVFHVWTRTRVVAAGYALYDLQQEHARLMAAQDELRIELGMLTAPQALDQAARTKLSKLGLAPPDRGAVWAAGPGRRESGPGRAGVGGGGRGSSPAPAGGANSRAGAGRGGADPPRARARPSSRGRGGAGGAPHRPGHRPGALRAVRQADHPCGVRGIRIRIGLVVLVLLSGLAAVGARAFQLQVLRSDREAVDHYLAELKLRPDRKSVV
jgi:type II secretory pathway pseudopilin PulG